MMKRPPENAIRLGPGEEFEFAPGAVKRLIGEPIGKRSKREGNCTLTITIGDGPSALCEFENKTEGLRWIWFEIRPKEGWESLLQ